MLQDTDKLSKSRQIRSRVFSKLDFSGEVTDDRILTEIDRAVMETEGLTVTEKLDLRRQAFNSFRGLDVLQELLDDEGITEIMVNGSSDIYYEKEGLLKRWNKCFESRDKLEDVIQRMVSGVDRRVNTASPIVDARLPDGSRVSIVLPPVAPEGPIVTIRRFPPVPMTMDRLIELGSIDNETAEFMKQCVIDGNNIFVSGGTGTGKTTFLNALSGAIPASERVVTVEDSIELQLTCPNLVKLEAREGNAEGYGAITIRELIRAALRMRPDRLIVGEVRGPETLDMLQAMNTGHDGSLSTGHGNSARDMLSRLETMVLMGGELPIQAIRGQIASAIDIMVHLARFRDGSRKVVTIHEIKGFENGEIILSELFEREGGKLCRKGTFSGRHRRN